MIGLDNTLQPKERKIKMMTILMDHLCSQRLARVPIELSEKVQKSLITLIMKRLHRLEID